MGEVESMDGSDAEESDENAADGDAGAQAQQRVQVQDNRLIRVLLIIKKIFKMLTSRRSNNK